MTNQVSSKEKTVFEAKFRQVKKFKRFLRLFWEHFVTKSCLHFLDQHKTLDFFNTWYDLIREKSFPLRRARAIFIILGTKKRLLLENACSKIVLDIIFMYKKMLENYYFLWKSIELTDALYIFCMCI
jgi:hypothetical protein